VSASAIYDALPAVLRDELERTPDSPCVPHTPPPTESQPGAVRIEFGVLTRDELKLLVQALIDLAAALGRGNPPQAVEVPLGQDRVLNVIPNYEAYKSPGSVLGLRGKLDLIEALEASVFEMRKQQALGIHPASPWGYLIRQKQQDLDNEYPALQSTLQTFLQDTLIRRGAASAASNPPRPSPEVTS
jgi:hypothetical protein